MRWSCFSTSSDFETEIVKLPDLPVKISLFEIFLKSNLSAVNAPLSSKCHPLIKLCIPLKGILLKAQLTKSCNKASEYLAFSFQRFYAQIFTK